MNLQPLISINEVKKVGLVNQNVDERLLSVALLRAQDIDLSAIIGKKFLRDLQVKKQQNNLNILEVELIVNYILPYLAISVDIRSVVATNNRIQNAGTGSVNATEFANNQQDKDLRFINYLKKDRDMIALDLVDFIESNEHEFPLYFGNGGDKPSFLDTIFVI